MTLPGGPITQGGESGGLGVIELDGSAACRAYRAARAQRAHDRATLGAANFAAITNPTPGLSASLKMLGTIGPAVQKAAKASPRPAVARTRQGRTRAPGR